MRRESFLENAPGQLVPVTLTEIDPVDYTPRVQKSWAFLPDPLPNELHLGGGLDQRLEAAAQAIGTLNGLATLLTNSYLLIRPFLRREAVASSRIEGTVADLRQLVLFEESEETAPPDSDVHEVYNYVRALEYGLRRPTDRSITESLIREMHRLLMEGVRGGHRAPGDYRQGQVYIGQQGTGIESARFVPPPGTEVPLLMHDLERYIVEPSTLPKLVRIALIHYQFETIHPFEDGNGRTGRLLIPLLLQQWNLLSRPLLYLSDYFERERRAYVDGLLAVSQRGDWEGWVGIFLDAVRFQADDAVKRGQRLLSLREEYRRRYQGKRPARALDAIDGLFETPTLTIKGLAERLEIPYSSALNVVTTLAADGVLIEATGRKRERVYLAAEILAILSQP
jgi:Fic family protein